MRASGPLVLKIFVKADEADDAGQLAETVRARAGELGLTDVALHQEAAGPVIQVSGDEPALRRFFADARDLGGLGLMVLQAA